METVVLMAEDKATGEGEGMLGDSEREVKE